MQLSRWPNAISGKSKLDRARIFLRFNCKLVCGAESFADLTNNKIVNLVADIVVTFALVVTQCQPNNIRTKRFN